ncbi:hypothetical protein N9Q07_00835, partial [Alphaproteobacteria bacterium]|nr:hypothetical protein [Alphaproteobacteria bacterium]
MKEKELKKYDKLPNCKEIFNTYYRWNNCRAEQINIHESKFFGEWKNGERYDGIEWLWSGGGKYDGNKYVGRWKNGQKHGKGTLYKPSGRKYIGNWKNNKMEGLLEYFD